MEAIQYPKEIKANRPHQCNYCGFEINKGEIYLKSVWKYDDIYTWKCHVDCQEIAGRLNMFDNADEGVTMDFFKEDITETYLNLTKGLDDNKQMPTFKDRLEYVKAHTIKKS